LADDFNYDAAGNFMWCCTMALNGLIQKGVITDWAVHAMGHELTAYFGIDHARTLAIIAPSHYRYNFEDKKGKLAQYAERVGELKTEVQKKKQNWESKNWKNSSTACISKPNFQNIRKIIKELLKE
jgi:NADP-dependent alcohol dehydrogenase